MDFLKLDNAGGLLLYQDHLKKLQKNFIDALRYITESYGQYVILDGCTVTGGTVSDGVVICNGEVMPFTGGTKDKVAIVETAATTGFVGNVQKNFFYTRTAVAGVSGVAFDSFKRMSKLSVIYDDVLAYINSIKRDNIDLNDTTKLATSKAVYELNKKAITLVYKSTADSMGFVNPHPSGGDFYTRIITVTHNLNLINYTVDNMKVYLPAWGWVSMNVYARALANNFADPLPPQSYFGGGLVYTSYTVDGFYNLTANSFKIYYCSAVIGTPATNDLESRKDQLAFWITKMG